MSRSLALFALVVTSLLGLVAVLVIGRSPAPPPSPNLFTFKPSEVRSLDISRADGTRDIIEPGAEPDTWIVRSIDRPGTPDRRWSILPARMRGAVRLLADARSLAETPPHESTADTTVVASLAGGRAASIAFSGSPLGGRIHARAFEGTVFRAVQTDANLADIFARRGVAEWLDPAPFSWVSGQPARITISSGKNPPIVLARVGASWAMTSPLEVKANPQAVANLIQSLGSLAFSRFETESSFGLDRAMGGEFTVEVETDLPGLTAEGHRTVRRQTLMVVPGGEGDQIKVWAITSTEVGPESNEYRGRIAGTIPAAALAPARDSYISLVLATSLELPAADVGSVTFLHAEAASAPPTTLARKAGVWHRGQSPLSPSDAQNLQTLLVLLAQSPALRTFDRLPAESSLFAIADVKGLSDQPLAVLRLYTAPAPAPAGAPSTGREILVVQNGQLCRVYNPENLPELLAWIRALTP
jgi:hypothetical protein